MMLQIEKFFSFRPDDTHNMHQIPPANVTMPGVERIKGYRYPAPGYVSLFRSVSNTTAPCSRPHG